MEQSLVCEHTILQETLTSLEKQKKDANHLEKQKILCHTLKSVKKSKGIDKFRGRCTIFLWLRITWLPVKCIIIAIHASVANQFVTAVWILQIKHCTVTSWGGTQKWWSFNPMYTLNSDFCLGCMVLLCFECSMELLARWYLRDLLHVFLPVPLFPQSTPPLFHKYTS